MDYAMPYRLLADIVLVAHLAVVVFVVGGLAAVVAGNLRGWRWVNCLRFRLAHAGAIAFVAVEEWLGQDCPLTTLESWLRTRAGDAAYANGFIEDCVRSVIFYEAPGWAFALVYTAFGLLVLIAWWRFPPSRRDDRGKDGS